MKLKLAVLCVVNAMLLLSSGNLCCAQIDPAALSSIPPEILQTAQRFSLSEQIGLLELEILGKSNPQSEPVERVIALEQSVFGHSDPSDTRALPDRITAVLTSIKPSNELVGHLCDESRKHPDWSSRKAKPPWLNTTFQRLAVLEACLLGRINTTASVSDRVAALQRAVRQDPSAVASQSIWDQISQLWTLINPTGGCVKQAQAQLKNAGFLGSDTGFVNSLGKGMKKTGQRFSQGFDPAKKILQSPTFWMALIGAGTVAGLSLMYASERNQNSESWEVKENRCTGEWSCRHCKNCNACKWCNGLGRTSPCGVFRRRYGFQ